MGALGNLDRLFITIMPRAQRYLLNHIKLSSLMAHWFGEN